jgi:AMP-binding enzyme/AMP-binding enzyme C-terminal domain
VFGSLIEVEQLLVPLMVTRSGRRPHPSKDPASGALSIGLPTAVEDVIVINDEGDPVEAGEQGELVVRGANVMVGYWRKPAETSQAMLAGWMRTGDVGFFDTLGWFYLVDRKKDMISASGLKVWPREVEDVLYAFPGVREAAVVGKPDPYRGETVVAFLSSIQGQSLDTEALHAHCRMRLAAYKCPVAFHVLADLPKTESGKITRAVLSQSLRGQQGLEGDESVDHKPSRPLRSRESCHRWAFVLKPVLSETIGWTLEHASPSQKCLTEFVSRLGTELDWRLQANTAALLTIYSMAVDSECRIRSSRVVARPRPAAARDTECDRSVVSVRTRSARCKDMFFSSLEACWPAPGAPASIARSPD